MAEDNPLTRRESQILDLLAEGLSNDEIARELTISPNTVKVHVRNIFEKMAVQSRTEATMEAVRRGWIKVPGIDTRTEEAETEPVRWPPLEVVWAPWQPLALLAALVMALALFLWPSQNPAQMANNADDFTSERGLVSTTPPPRVEVARWSQRASMPTPRGRAAAAVLEGQMYVVGGENEEGDLADLQLYDPDFDVWQTLPPRPVAARSAAAAFLAGRLYVAGGCQGDQVLQRMDRFDPGSQTWREAAPLPERRCGFVLVALQGRLYAIGGWDGEKIQDSLFIYSPEQDRWEEGRRLPQPRAFLAGTALKGKIYALGGRDETGQRAEVWLYDPAADAWSPAPEMPAPRDGIVAVSEGNSLYVFGGGGESEPHLHERFDTLVQGWSTIDSPRQGPWRNAAAGVIGPNLHIVGGWGGSFLGVHEAYQAAFRTFLPLGAQGVD